MPSGLPTVVTCGAPGAMPKSNGATPMTGNSDGSAEWSDADAASMLTPLPTSTALEGVLVCVWFWPAMNADIRRILLFFCQGVCGAQYCSLSVSGAFIA